VTGKLPSKKIDNNKYRDFIKVAESFQKGAELAQEFGYYNAAGVLIIHSAIAYADSITIKFSSLKIKGASHYDIIALLNNILPSDKKDKTALDQFKKLIDHKTMVSYSGDVYNKSDIEKLAKHFNRFLNWANLLLIE
jgi:HEPN domain-containing protein